MWYCNDYTSYATVIIVLTILSLIVSVWETRVNLVSIQKLSKYSCEVTVFRKDEKGELTPTKMSSTELVPGDLYEIPDDGLAMPCDTILVNGSVIINESMLTGESTPILKNHMPSVEGVLFDTNANDSDKYFLYGGTKVVQKRAVKGYKVLGIVYSTGFKTFKGNLIRQILYPKETEEKFKKDSGKYITFMAILCLVGYLISLGFLIDNGSYSTKHLIMKFLDLITTTVPPSLPACISVGISNATSRLKRKKILCIARERINQAGKVNIICFDKTGTLTEDHLDISGYVPVQIDQGKFYFDRFSETSIPYSVNVFEHYKNKNLNQSYHDKNKDIMQLYVECLACCHGITYVNNKLIGDPIDVKMFEGVGWTLKENNTSASQDNQEQKEAENTNYDPLISSYVRPKEEQDLNYKLSQLKDNEDGDEIIKTHYEIGIVRRFDFSSKLQRMSAIGKNINEKYFKAFCKGSPEKIKELCKPDTIPSDFNEQLASYTSKGYRVLAMATKSIKMNFTQSQQVLREFVECNMIFLGLLIVRNKLKTATAPTIELLDNADIRMVMATGDNILTAISVSKECKLVSKNSLIYSCNIEKDENGKDKLTWSKVDNYVDDNENESKVPEIEKLSVNLKSNNESTQVKGRTADSSAFSKDFPAEEFNDKFSFNSLAIRPKVEEENPLRDQNGGISKREDTEHEQNSEYEISLNVQTNNSLADENKIYIIAITGSNFEKICKLNEKYKQTKEQKYYQHHVVFRQILKNGVVFARMTPEHKALLVESFKKEQFTVLMCGDGANDCSALRTADVGISLSPEEASIAAHFTSQIPDISCVVELLKEGKCSLTTSIQTFKYMMLYSLIQFIAVTLLMILNSYLGDWQFLASDLFIIFPLAFLVALTGPYEKLTHDYPISSLLSVIVITSILLQTIISFVFQLGGRALLYNSFSWYRDKDIMPECEMDEDDYIVPCKDNTVLFIISDLQYLLTGIVFSVSKPFRKPFYTNIWLMIYLIAVVFYSFWLNLNPDDWSSDLFEIIIRDFDEQNKNFKYYLFLITIVNIIVALFFEWVVMKWLEKVYNRVIIRKRKERLIESVKNKEKDIEYPICDFQRAYYAERREKMNLK